MVEKRGRNAWWWDEKVKQGPNDRKCVDREAHPRHARAEQRILQNLISQEFSVKTLIGDAVVFVVSWLGSDVSLEVRDPQGNVIPPMDSATVSYEKGEDGEHYEMYRITGGGRDVWRVTATGTDLPPEGEEIYFRAFDISIPCEDVDRDSETIDSDADGIANRRDREPCDWDENDDGISDGCDPDSPGEGADTCIDPVDGSPRDVDIPTPVPPTAAPPTALPPPTPFTVTPVALFTPTPP
jgi:hypothetical protein